MGEAVHGKGDYAAINGLRLYTETYGEGDPIILLHGGFGVVAMFARLIPVLAASRQVIVVEMQGHGHTADIDRPLSYEQLADDTAALIAHLGFEQADVLGYSLGGGAALQTAIRHPQRVRKLVVVSAPCRRTGWYPDVLAGMATVTAENAIELVGGSPMHQAYVAVAPRPDDFPLLAQKTNDLLSKDYDWSAEVEALPMPVQIIIGDADSISPVYAAEMYHLLGGGLADTLTRPRSKSELAILPGTTHYDIVERVELLRAIIPPFLDGASQPSPWIFSGVEANHDGA
ncbi:MAG: alpha/beta hydrolase [Anaerolineae bacterium]|nr:alpha/beta hydrolase [Anaerolineae bacterium]